MPLSDQNQNDERTESPTAYRREEFRRQGRVALSRDLMSFGVLFAAGTSYYLFRNSVAQEFDGFTRSFLSFSRPTEDFSRDAWVQMLQKIALSFTYSTGPLLVWLMIVALMVGAAQVGIYFSSESLTINWERINPVNGLQRFLSRKVLFDIVKVMGKFVVACAVSYLFFKKEIFGIYHMMEVNPQALPGQLFAILLKFFFIALSSFLAIAALDYGFERFTFEQSLKMTKQEAKEEFKLREGDPLIRNRIKNIQRKLARQRMMEEVPKADVIVTNPTHLAIALQYDSAVMPSPKVIAKGAGVVAQKIKELAKTHQIPCVENKPLARSLYKMLDINEYVPRELFKAVAEVLAYVYRLRGRFSV